MKTSEILTKARALIDTPEKWTQGAYARLINSDLQSVDGQFPEVDWSNEMAACFCSLGAIFRTVTDCPDLDTHATPAIMALGAQTEDPFGKQAAGSRQAVAAFNDSHTHQEVMAMFDRAIAEQEVMALFDEPLPTLNPKEINMSTINPIAALAQLRQLTKVHLGKEYNGIIRNAVDVLEMFIDDNGGQGLPGTSERLIVMGALREVLRARKLFPGNNLNLLALGEEYGGLIKACMDEGSPAIYKEGIQTIAMVIRVLTEGDPSTNDFRASKDLAPIVEQKEEAKKGIKFELFGDHDSAVIHVSKLLAMRNMRDIRIVENEEKVKTWKVSWIEI